MTITEASPYERESASRGHYSRSKLAADRAAHGAARSGAPVVVLRPRLRIGPGQVKHRAAHRLQLLQRFAIDGFIRRK